MRKIRKGIGRKAKGREQKDNGWRQVKILDLRLGISDFKKEYLSFYSEIQNLFASILKRLVGSSCPGVTRRAKPEAIHGLDAKRSFHTWIFLNIMTT
jgi:hypothetical protein